MARSGWAPRLMWGPAPSDHSTCPPQLPHPRMHWLGTHPGQVLQAPEVRRPVGPLQGSWETGWAAGVSEPLSGPGPLRGSRIFCLCPRLLSRPSDPGTMTPSLLRPMCHGMQCPGLPAGAAPNLDSRVALLRAHLTALGSELSTRCHCCHCTA